MTVAQYRKFIELWHELPCMAEVALAMGLDRRACSNLAGALRRRGVILPKHALVAGLRGGVTEHVDWNALKLWSETCRAASVMRRYRSAQ